MNLNLFPKQISPSFHRCRRQIGNLLFCIVPIVAVSQYPAPSIISNQIPHIEIPAPAVLLPSLYNNRTGELQVFHSPVENWRADAAPKNEYHLPTGLVDPGQVSRQATMERELMEDELYRKNREHLEAIRYFQKAFVDLSSLDAHHFSITRAQYDIENACLNGALPYDRYMRGVRGRANLVRQILKREGLKANSNLAVNYGIQQLYQHPNLYYDSTRRQFLTVPPFTYEFDDFMGEKDYENILTEKLMRTGRGQCLSMPRLYLMIAEQLGAKAWLSLAPQHSFIKFADSRGNLYNYETTNGNVASGSWLASSGFINAKALKNKTYLDTLSQPQLYSQCLTDLLVAYLHQFQYDDFAEAIKKKALEADPSNMRAMIVDANAKTERALGQIIAAGRPKMADLPKFPAAYQAYQEMKAAVDKVEGLGYQDMPAEAYQGWLKSIEQEKKKQASRELNARLQQQINQLKQHKSTIKPSKIN